MRDATALSLACALAWTAVSACAKDENAGDSGAGTDDGGGGEGAELKVVSYNVGLAFGYVPEASARKDAVIEAVQSSDADVLCLQELWTNQSDDGAWTTAVIDELLAASAGTFEHQYWSRTTTSDTAPAMGCTIDESEPLEACAQDNCGDESPENLGDCVLTNCAESFNATSAGCQSCLAANLGSPLDEIIAACKGVISSGVVYDGHNGLALLSKHPLSNPEIMELDYALTARAVLRATVTPEGAEAVDIYCTHLASDLSNSIAYPPGGSYESFAEENAAQATAVVEWAATASAPTVVLAGDFNHGPAIATGHAELPANYQQILDAGYADPIADSGAFCTFCESNTLQGGAGTDGELIDHVYVKGSATVGEASVVYDDTVSVTTADGTDQMLHRSDHFGVAVSLSVPAP